MELSPTLCSFHDFFNVWVDGNCWQRSQRSTYSPKRTFPKSAPAPWNSSLLTSLGLGELGQVPTRLYVLESAQYLAQQLTDSKASVNVCWQSGKRKMEEARRIGQGALNWHCCLVSKLYPTHSRLSRRSATLGQVTWINGAFAASFSFLPCHATCRILLTIPQPRIEPRSQQWNLQVLSTGPPENPCSSFEVTPNTVRMILCSKPGLFNLVTMGFLVIL